MDDQAVPVVSYARISADTARDEHGVADQHKSTARRQRDWAGRSCTRSPTTTGQRASSASFGKASSSSCGFCGRVTSEWDVRTWCGRGRQ
jgi:hypothetical protein